MSIGRSGVRRQVRKELPTMRYISIFTNEQKKAGPPSQEMMAKMGALIEQGFKQGWLIATEGVSFTDKPIKVNSTKGKITVTDGPFAEAKEVLGGYALLEAKDREHVLELTRQFLAVAGDGTCEIHELYVAEGSSTPPRAPQDR
jgi:hypothetical protein